MKKLVYALCVISLSLTGCSKTSDPSERAAELIRAKGIELPSFNHMDSVMGYPQAFSCEMSAYLLEWQADSLLNAHIKNGTVSANQKELLDLGETVFDLKAKAAQIEMNERVARTPKEFVGYEVSVSAPLSDDGVYRVLMDKDMERVAIQKIKK